MGAKLPGAKGIRLLDVLDRQIDGWDADFGAENGERLSGYVDVVMWGVAGRLVGSWKGSRELVNIIGFSDGVLHDASHASAR